MQKGKVITLDDKDNYLLLLDTLVEGKKFYYANKLDDKENTTSEYAIFEEIVEDNVTYIEEVLDEKVKEFLNTVFQVELLDLAKDLQEK